MEELAASSVAAFEAGSNISVVRVDEVIHSSPVRAQPGAQRVTVELQVAGSVTAGQQYTFYATTLVFGESIVMREVSHHTVQATEAVSAQVARANRERRG